MKNLAKIAHAKVAEFCYQMAEKEHLGYAKAAWFEQNGSEEIERLLNARDVVEWLDRAQELGYSIDDVEIKPYISTHWTWYNWVSFEIVIPIYGSKRLDQIVFPRNSELPKDFVVPFLEREEKEAAEEKARKDAEKLAEEKAKTEREQEKEQEREKREQEKADWIRNNGSQYLKDCLELGIKANREYVIERAAMEHPGFTVDYTDNADWEEIFSPSPEALQELKELRNAGVNANLVWLIKPAKTGKDDDDDNEDEYYVSMFESCEALVIRDFLGRYDLVKIV